VENGPFSVSPDGKRLIRRSHSWNEQFSMIYIDNPVGTGFSFTESKEGFCTNETDVANDLYSVLQQFFLVFPELVPLEFYVTGESYGGKYVPSIAYKIHIENEALKERHSNKQKQIFINLQGIAIGDGLMDPLTQFTGFGPLLYTLGLADENEVEEISNYEKTFVQLLDAGDYKGAFEVFDMLMNGDFYPYPTYFENITGTTNYYNLLDPVYPPNPYATFLIANVTRKAIHVGAYQFSDSNSTVELYLIDDWMHSVANIMPTLLNNYKVMTYNGQVDIILGPSLAEKYYKVIPWDGQQQYLQANKTIWKSSTDDISGYVRSVGKYRQVIIRGAGHLAPLDQPARLYDMITRFVLNKPF